MREPKTDIYQFQTRLAQVLAQWGGISIGTAAVLALLGGNPHLSGDRRRFWHGVASQAAAWGVIDLAIALVGLHRAEMRVADPASHTRKRQSEERRSLRKILWINSSLDIGYILGGVTLAATKGKKDAFWRGSGWSIVIQGGFLLALDTVHALLLKD